jgi:signal transduction histidine kinase
LNILNNAFYALAEKLLDSENKFAAASAECIAGETSHSTSDEHLIAVMPDQVNDSFAGDKQHPKSSANKKRYEPAIWISTNRLENVLEIRIKDNGTGISPELTGKIFQPFFTTKPTGSGTGLGLSLAYEIITHGHGGELLVSSELEEYSEFIIRLPF